MKFTVPQFFSKFSDSMKAVSNLTVLDCKVLWIVLEFIQKPLLNLLDFTNFDLFHILMKVQIQTPKIR